MATLRKSSFKCGNYIVDFEVDGKRYIRSTRTKDIKTARLITLRISMGDHLTNKVRLWERFFANHNLNRLLDKPGNPGNYGMQIAFLYFWVFWSWLQRRIHIDANQYEKMQMERCFLHITGEFGCFVVILDAPIPKRYRLFFFSLSHIVNRYYIIKIPYSTYVGFNLGTLT